MINIIRKIKTGYEILKSPEKSFKTLPEKQLDDILGTYISLLLVSSVLSGVITFALNMLKSAYYGVFLGAEIDYMSILNYSLGISMSFLFFFIFAGTVIFFIMSAVFKLIIKLEYVHLLKVMMISATPLVLFGWVPWTTPGIILWSIVLFNIGIKNS